MKYTVIFSILLTAMLSVVCSVYASGDEITTTIVTTKTVTTKACCDKKKVVHKKPRKQHVVKRYITPVQNYEPVRNEWRRVEVIQTPRVMYQPIQYRGYVYPDYYYYRGSYYGGDRYGHYR